MGKVYLIGAGPGDPELLTVKAARILASADIVLHDALVTQEILELASPQGAHHRRGQALRTKTADPGRDQRLSHSRVQPWPASWCA